MPLLPKQQRQQATPASRRRHAVVWGSMAFHHAFSPTILPGFGLIGASRVGAPGAHETRSIEPLTPDALTLFSPQDRSSGTTGLSVGKDICEQLSCRSNQAIGIQVSVSEIVLLITLVGLSILKS